ncbi:MAG: FG-GAP-like repeat-containing protein [Acidobacteria bacterium]|nr:FG-GAP-like repeat-containing protein [Acidobacteriota bacterium]
MSRFSPKQASLISRLFSVLPITATVLCLAFLISWGRLIVVDASLHNSSAPEKTGESRKDRAGGVKYRLRSGSGIASVYVGSPESRRALDQNLAEPLSLTTGDFDEDGVPDLAGGYAVEGRGALSLYRGNVDAIYPNTPEARRRMRQAAGSNKGQAAAPAPFHSTTNVFDLPVAPDFIGAGDFDADGHLDLVAAARGGTELYLFAGNGKGEFSAAKEIELSGRVTALVAGEINRADGLADVVVGIVEGGSSKALIFEGPEGAMRAQAEEFAQPGEVAALALGRVDGDYLFDLVVAAGRELVIVHGRDRRLSLDLAQRDAAPAAKLSRISASSAIKSVAIGNFTDNARMQVAALGDDGVAQVISAATDELKSETLYGGSGPLAGRLIGARASGGRFDDLVVLDAASHRLRVVNAKSEGAGNPVAEFDVESAPVVAVAMRLSVHARNDLVFFRRGQSAPVIATPEVTAATFVVNSNGNGSDAQPGDGICSTPAGTAQGVCTLRAAIQEANASPGPDAINFNIPTDVPKTIRPSASPSPALIPDITSPVTIDATTQPGFAGAPIIELSGELLVPGSFNGLTIRANDCVVRGLVINRFSGDGIIVAGDGNTIEGNFIGTDVTGTLDRGNEFNGVRVTLLSDFNTRASNNRIGGTTAAARNVISGNGDVAAPSRNAVQLEGDVSVSGNLVQGNYLGVDATGGRALGNTRSGVVVNFGASNNIIGGAAAGAGNIILDNTESGVYIQHSDSAGNLVQGNLIGFNGKGLTAGHNLDGVTIDGASRNTVGGTTPAARNVISSNNWGIEIVGFAGDDASGNLIQGNYIGTDISGAGNIGNFIDGIRIGSPRNDSDTAMAPRNNVAVISNNSIGGVTAGAGNVIAFNGEEGGNGITIVNSDSGNPSVRNPIFGNSIFANSSLGIDLGNNRVTQNDAGDADTGPNNLQNYPVLISALNNIKQTTVNGTLNSAPNTSFRVEFFSNAACDISGFGEGETFLGAIDVTTNANGAASFSAPLSTLVPTNRVITATATDPGGNTSEFSRCVTVVEARSDLVITKTDSPDPVNVGSPLTYAIVVSNSGPNTATNVVVTDALPAGVTFNSVTTSQGSCTAPPVGGTGTVTCSIGSIPAPPPVIGALKGPGLIGSDPASASQQPQPSRVTITIVVTPTVGGTITNTATVAGEESDPNANNNRATAMTEVQGANLAIVKTVATLLPGPGDELRFTLRVDNIGSGPAANVTLTDAVPANTVFKSLPAAQGWNCTTPQPGGGGNIACGISAFPAGASAIFSLALTVNNDVTKDTLITNIARVTTTTFDSDLNNNSSTAIARVGAPQVNIPLGARVEVGPVNPLREPSTDPANGTFQIGNIGNATLFLTPVSLLRVAPNIDRFTAPPDDRSIFIASLVTPGRDVPLLFTPNGVIPILPGQQLTFRVVFNPIIPIRACRTSGLAANQALPDTINSQLRLVTQSGAPVTIDVVGRVSTAAIMTHPLDPRRSPQVTMEQSGNGIKVESWVYDPNMDTQLIRYQFLDSAGAPVGLPVDVGLAPSIAAANLARGQIFGIEQNFESDVSVSSVRVTIFDVGNNGVTALSGPGGPTGCSFNTVSGASFTEFGLSSDSIAAGFGVNLAGSVQLAGGSSLPTTLAGASVRFRDGAGVERLAPLFFVSPNQINYQIPDGVSPGAATVTVNNGDNAVAMSALRITQVWPGLFSANGNGSGVAAAVALRVKADGAQSYEPVARFDQTLNQHVSIPINMDDPADQVFLVLYGTGLRHRRSLESVKARIGGMEAPVLYAGALASYAGLDQINVALPRELRGQGELDVLLTVDGYASNIVRINTGGASLAASAGETGVTPLLTRPLPVNPAPRAVIVLPTVRLTPHSEQR